MFVGLHVKYKQFLSDFNETLIFLDRFSENLQTSDLLITRRVEAKSFHANEWTDGQTQGQT
jgi:hypothetical protein